MDIMYAVISYDANTGQAFNVVGWSDNEKQARALESRMNDIAESFTGEGLEPLVEYRTEVIQLYGCVHEYQPYGDFDALIRNDIFRAIIPAGQGDHYRYLCEDAGVVHCMNFLKGLGNYRNQEGEPKMTIVYAVISYDTNTGQAFNVVGWSANEPEASELESRMNDLSEHFAGNATPLIEYGTVDIQLYGCTAEYQPYGEFDALIRNGIFRAIVPAGQGDHYSYLCEDAGVVHCANLLGGLDNYINRDFK